MEKSTQIIHPDFLDLSLIDFWLTAALKEEIMESAPS
jgi:hypothetical protein